MKKVIGLLIVALIISVVSFAWVKGVRPLSWGIHDEIYAKGSNKNAVDGYDVMEYHLNGRTVKGDGAHSLKWKNVNWNFVSEENKRIFESDPQKYMPQHGGYCAYAHEKGFTANTDPTTFKIVDGKLYLFADEDMKENWQVEYNN